jgi:hypothetical protein
MAHDRDYPFFLLRYGPGVSLGGIVDPNRSSLLEATR